MNILKVKFPEYTETEFEWFAAHGNLFKHTAEIIPYEVFLRYRERKLRWLKTIELAKTTRTLENKTVAAEVEVLLPRK